MAKHYYNMGERTPAGRLPKNVKYLTTAAEWEATLGYEADLLSDNYGFCVNSCAVTTEYGDKLDPDNVTVYFTDIDWDTDD